MEKKFNQAKYINDYKKEHYSVFKVNLKKEEKKELDELLKKYGMNQAEFLRYAINEFKTKKNSKDK